MALSCLMKQCSLRIQGLPLKVLKNDIFRLSSLTATSKCYNQFSTDRSKTYLMPTPMMKAVEKCPPSLSTIAKNFSMTQVQRSSANSDHVKIWTIERFVALALVPLLPAMFFESNQAVETAVAVLTVMHVHWGVEAIVIDYIRPIVFGNFIPKVGIVFVFLLSIVTLAGLLNLIYNDCGIANAVRELWKM